MTTELDFCPGCGEYYGPNHPRPVPIDATTKKRLRRWGHIENMGVGFALAAAVELWLFGVDQFRLALGLAGLCVVTFAIWRRRRLQQ